MTTVSSSSSLPVTFETGQVSLLQGRRQRVLLARCGRAIVFLPADIYREEAARAARQLSAALEVPITGDWRASVWDSSEATAAEAFAKSLGGDVGFSTR